MNAKINRKNRVSKDKKFDEQINFIQKYAVIILSVFTFLLYIQVVNFDFTGFDDRTIIQDNSELLSSMSNIGKVFLNDAFFQGGQQQFFRPLQNVTFLFDNVISGGNTSMYHFSNLLFHIIAVIALYYLLLELGFSAKISLISTLIFASSPLFNHAVVWVPGRGDILLGIFSILFLLYLVKYLKTQDLKYLVYNFIAFLFAVLSKESALLLPLIAVLFVITYDNKILLSKKSILPAISYTVIVVAYFILRNSVITSQSSSQNFGIDILLENLQVLPEIIGKFILPYNLSTLPNYSIINIVSGILAISLIVIAMFNKNANQKRPLMLFAIIWFVLFSIPGMLYKHDFGSFAYDYLEHRAYVPIIGMIILLNIIIQNFKFTEKKSLSVVLAFVVLFSIFTIKNSRNYENDLTLYERSIATNPETAALAYLNRGLIKARSGNQKLAIDDFNKAAEIFPEYPDAYSNRALAQSELGNKQGILEDYNKAIELNPKNQIFYFNRGIFKAANSNKNGAIDDYTIAIELNSQYKDAYRNITYELNQISDFAKSIEFATKGIENIPNYDELYLNRGIAKFQLNDKDGACADWQSASRRGNKGASDLVKKYCQ